MFISPQFFLFTHTTQEKRFFFNDLHLRPNSSCQSSSSASGSSVDIKLEVRVKSAQNLPILHGGVIFPSGRADVAGRLQPERIFNHL